MARHISFYNSDTGSRDLGAELNYTRETPEEVVLAKAVELARTHGTNGVLVIRTQPYNGKPGSWYIKGFSSRFSYDDLRAKVQANIDAGKFTRRECWLIRV
jgi:hypothetical protein